MRDPHANGTDYYDMVYSMIYGPVYDALTERTLKIVRELTPSRGRVIDYGAGTGRLSIPLATLGYEVTSVEVSHGMADVIARKCQEANAAVRICRQSIHDAVPDLHCACDCGVSVFTVLNYTVTVAEMVAFAASAAAAIRPGGNLLISFVENMRRMQEFFHRRNPFVHQDMRGSLSRTVRIEPREAAVYDYVEHTRLTIDGNTHDYQNRFPLREWRQSELNEVFAAAGFTLNGNESAKLCRQFDATGETYLLFQRQP